MRRRLGAFWLCLSFAGLGQTVAVAADSSESLLFGQSAALSGPASELGSGMRLGLLAAFDEINRSGGVHGRRLSLISLDDAYEPEAAIANTRALIREHDVFALVGAV
ncbi:MAG: ABC transporter substrate-binding protein, partial [Gammaproteobacteria bacterium]|nr:ABC transporter substrate-binding protein [Gammaproteobacteria bacterium]